MSLERYKGPAPPQLGQLCLLPPSSPCSRNSDHVPGKSPDDSSLKSGSGGSQATPAWCRKRYKQLFQREPKCSAHCPCDPVVALQELHHPVEHPALPPTSPVQVSKQVQLLCSSPHLFHSFFPGGCSAASTRLIFFLGLSCLYGPKSLLLEPPALSDVWGYLSK